jgi:Abortive infection alpha
MPALVKERARNPFKLKWIAFIEKRIVKNKKTTSDISIVVPKQSTGRLLDAFTDMIRPFSEARGLKADQIRLQREEVAIEIAKRAKQRLDIKKGVEHPVPIKILVPLMEAASLEDLGDDFMIEKWANLLASAATSNSVEPRFISILKELQGRQAIIFEAMANNNVDIVRNGSLMLEDADCRGINYIRVNLRGIFDQKNTTLMLTLLMRQSFLVLTYLEVQSMAF